MEHIPLTIKFLGHSDVDIVIAARKELLLQGRNVVPYLEDALANTDQAVVAEAARLLGLFRKESMDAVDALLQ